MAKNFTFVGFLKGVHMHLLHPLDPPLSVIIRVLRYTSEKVNKYHSQSVLNINLDREVIQLLAYTK